jgi:hypothetical protein
MTKEANKFAEEHLLLKEGVNIDVSFSVEAQRWDLQIRSRAAVKTHYGTEVIQRYSQSIELDRVLILYPDDPQKGVEGEIETEISIMWQSLIRSIQKHLEKQGLLLGYDAFNDYIQDRMARQKKRNKERQEALKEE